jgi:DNA-binding CsgD family transcriptional regulator
MWDAKSMIKEKRKKGKSNEERKRKERESHHTVRASVNNILSLPYP